MYIFSKSISLSLSCAWGKLTLTHVWSDISVEHDSIFLTYLTIPSAAPGEGLTEWRENAYHPLWRPGQWGEQVPGQRGATNSHHESLRQSAGLRTFWTRIQREAAVFAFPSRRDTMICDNRALSPLETMEKNHILQGQTRAVHKYATRQTNTKTCHELF